MQLIFIVIIIFGAIGFYFYNHHRKSKILPEQIIEVKKLINALNQSKIEISFCIYDLDIGMTVIEKPVSVNLFGISMFSSEKKYFDFEDDLILFEEKSNQLVDIKKSVNTKVLPKIILEDLSDFCNTEFNVMEFDDNDDRPKRFVLLKNYSNYEAEDQAMNSTEILFKGNAIAFESWMNLKDHVEQLEFVILQWLKDAGIEENEIMRKFELYEDKVL